MAVVVILPTHCPRRRRSKRYTSSVRHKDVAKLLEGEAI